MLIGVVSDNHGLIDPQLPRVLAGAEEIWHAGDLVAPEIVAALERIAPVIVVRGNNDVGRIVSELPEEQLIERMGHRFLIRHIVGKPPRLDVAAKRSIARHRPRIVVCGHSHQPLAAEQGGVLYLNPGSCGPRRFKLPRTAARVELDQHRLEMTWIDLDSGREDRASFSLD